MWRLETAAAMAPLVQVMPAAMGWGTAQPRLQRPNELVPMQTTAPSLVQGVQSPEPDAGVPFDGAPAEGAPAEGAEGCAEG
jgi:hypothetical protein